MAAIDFPDSPTVGQIFGASNGVNYQWNGTLWLAVGGFNAPSPGGDFYATGGTGAAFSTTPAVVIPNTVVTGNASGSYSTSTGRFTPPAGRFFVFGSVVGRSNAGSFFNAYLYKNGVIVPNVQSTMHTTVASAQQTPFVGAVVDANGTDYFQLFAAATSASDTVQFSWFGAFPISGIKGPPGDPGQLGWRLLNRQTVASPVATLDFTGIPADINDLKFTFDLLPVANGDDLILRFYDSVGALDITSGHYEWGHQHVYTTIATGGSPVGMTGTSIGVTSAIFLDYASGTARINNSAASGGIMGSGTFVNIRNTARHKSVDFQSGYLDNAGTAYRHVVGNGRRTVAGLISGFRLAFGSGNIASGAFSVWGSP